MANKKPKPIVEAEKKGTVSSFFDNIKNFFKGLRDKFKEFWEYARRRTTPYEKSVEGQAARTYNTSFKPSDQLYEEAEKFPGFDEMTLRQGSYIKLPAGTETVWHLNNADDVHKYLNAIEAKFPDMQDPATTHQGEFITEIARTLEIAHSKGQDMTQLYVVGHAIIAAEVHDGNMTVTISDRDHHMKFDGTNTSTLRSDIANLYAAFSGYDSPANFYIDTQTGTRYMQIQTDEHGYDTYIAEPMKRHINDYDSKQGVSHKFVMPGVVEVQGPDVLPRSFLDKAIAIDTPMEWKDFANIMTAMHESLFTAEGQKGQEPRTEMNRHSVYVTSDKMFWMTRSENGDFIAHVAPAHCKYPNVATIDVPVPEEAMTWSKDGQKALAKAVNQAVGKLNHIIADLDDKDKAAFDLAQGLEAEMERRRTRPIGGIDWSNQHIGESYDDKIAQQILANMRPKGIESDTIGNTDKHELADDDVTIDDDSDR